ncbi:MAG: hypothetical protein NTZ17_06790 [Phycisphaerae bacterium]|nr:hypothetical protein [Phycisphaerae bacterium]
MRAAPDFSKELQRAFEVDERCFDCVELYHGCNARPEAPDSRCADYFPLPDVGVNGRTGQEIPPSRMGDRKEPRIRSDAKQAVPAPVALDGTRACKCGRLMGKRRRLCDYCRDSKRAKSQRKYQMDHKPSKTLSGVPQDAQGEPLVCVEFAQTGGKAVWLGLRG